MITVYGANISIDQIRSTPLIRPDRAGRRWRGIDHGTMINELVSEFARREWQVASSKMALTGPKGNEGADLACAFELDISEILPPDGQKFSLGLLTSNNLKHATKIYSGTEIQICSNGLTVGEHVYSRKHTTGFNLKDAIPSIIDSYFASIQQIGGMIERLKHRHLTKDESNEIILNAGRQGLIPWSRLSALNNEYLRPIHQEFGRGTAFTMMNSFNSVIKRSPIATQMGAINKFRQLLPLAIAA